MPSCSLSNSVCSFLPLAKLMSLWQLSIFIGWETFTNFWHCVYFFTMVTTCLWCRCSYNMVSSVLMQTMTSVRTFSMANATGLFVGSTTHPHHWMQDPHKLYLPWWALHQSRVYVLLQLMLSGLLRCTLACASSYCECKSTWSNMMCYTCSYFRADRPVWVLGTVVIE